MNILVTLPKVLIDAIIAGDKIFEMRSVCPKHLHVGEDGFFCVEKGSDSIRCWCRVDYILKIDVQSESYHGLSKELYISDEYLADYLMSHKRNYLWKIGKVIAFEKDAIIKEHLFVDGNPQSFAYCPLSHGQSYEYLTH